jgi:UDP-N-acetylmuramoyl-L-alanyl-D-glutamate--2,6-diaminopimelate ligase
MPKTLSELIATLPDVVRVTGDTTISAPVVESDADVQPGGVFVARRGLSVDGHDFIPKAIERGAVTIVGEHEMTDLPVPYVQVKNAQESVGYLAAAYHDFPSRKLVVIGVTGTDGKTTTSTLIHSILQVATGGKAGLISTVSAVIGDKTLDTGLHVTTPSAPQIQSLLAHMVANGLTHTVLEMTSHGLAQGRLNGVDIDVAVLTNITHEHLDYHGTFENYRAAKSRMFEMLGNSYRKQNQPKVSVINADDTNAEFFASFPADEVIRYGKSDQADWRITDIDFRPDETDFILVCEWAENQQWLKEHNGTIQPVAFKVHTRLLGEFNVINVTAAIAATGLNGAAQEAATNVYSGRVPGVWIIPMKEGIEDVTTIPGRLERIDEGQSFNAIVDFAHTPNALEKALTACRTMLKEGSRLIAVFGSAGLRDKEKRRLMAEVSIRHADFTILTAEDPRTESLDDILQTMADAATAVGGVEGETFIRIPDRGEAIYRACQMAQPGDIVIACGKGHEQSMAFGTTEYSWDDRDAMRSALRGAPLRTLPTARTS